MPALAGMTASERLGGRQVADFGAQEVERIESLTEARPARLHPSAPGSSERLGEEQAAVMQPAGVDAVPDSQR